MMATLPNGANELARQQVEATLIKSKISGGTYSDAAGDYRDALLGLMHTCAKLGIAFWDYLGDRIGIVRHDAEFRHVDGKRLGSTSIHVAAASGMLWTRSRLAMARPPRWA